MTKKDPKAFVTNESLDDAVGTILRGMDNMFENITTKDDLATTEKRLSKRLDKVESDIYFVGQDIKDIKSDLSDTPTLRQFNTLKAKVNKISLIS